MKIFKLKTGQKFSFCPQMPREKRTNARLEWVQKCVVENVYVHEHLDKKKDKLK